jgi:ankyrin repeat protein
MDSGETALMAAARSDSVEMATLLLKHGAAVKPRDSRGMSAFAEILQNLSTGVLKLFVQHFSDPILKECTGWDDLTLAVWKGDEKKVEELLSRGFKTNEKCNRGYSPLIGACAMGETDLVKLLLAKGANANSTKCGITPLIAAAASGNLETVKLVMANGADANAVVDALLR